MRYLGGRKHTHEVEEEDLRNLTEKVAEIHHVVEHQKMVVNESEHILTTDVAGDGALEQQQNRLIADNS